MAIELPRLDWVIRGRWRPSHSAGGIASFAGDGGHRTPAAGMRSSADGGHRLDGDVRRGAAVESQGGVGTQPRMRAAQPSGWAGGCEACHRASSDGSPRPSETVHDAEKANSPASESWAVQKRPRQRPTLPQSCPCSTIGPGELNFRVRDGNGCGLSGIAAGKNKMKHERC